MSDQLLNSKKNISITYELKILYFIELQDYISELWSPYVNARLAKLCAHVLYNKYSVINL